MEQARYIFLKGKTMRCKNYFDGKKASISESYVKEKFQLMLQNTDNQTEIFSTIWGNNLGLREDLFPETVGLNATDLSNIKPSILTKFQANISIISNGFYNFIKVK